MPSQSFEPPDDSEIPDAAFEAPDAEGEDEGDSALEASQELAPVAAVPAPAAGLKKPKEVPSYWTAVINALPPEKQTAAWHFYNEHDLHHALGGTNVLTGLVLLMEANGLFMGDCARQMVAASETIQKIPGEILAKPPDLKPILSGFIELQDRIEGFKSEIVTELKGILASPPGSSRGAVDSIASVEASKGRFGGAAAPMFLGVLLGLIIGGFGCYAAKRYYEEIYGYKLKEELRNVKTWLSAEEQARAIILSRKAKLGIELFRDPELSGRKVYALTVDGVKIERAFISTKGVGVIEFAPGGADNGL